MDLRKATELFADPAFDGQPVQIYEPTANDPIVPPDEPGEATEDEETVICGVQIGPQGKGRRRAKSEYDQAVKELEQDIYRAA